MRKRNPRDVVDGFISSTEELQAYYITVLGEFAGQPLEAAILSILAEQTCLSLAVTWEVFIDGYFVACINRDSRTFKNNLRKRMRESISGRFDEKASRYTQIALPRHPALEDVVALAAPQERNISFSSAERMVNDSRDWLGPQYSSKFSALSRQDLDFIDSLIGIRNYLAHQSTSAGRVMNKALGK